MSLHSPTQNSKATILQNNQLDFLKEIVSLIPDIQTADEQLEHPANYADYLSLASNNSNHHKLGNPIQRQFSHPSTSHNPLRRATNLGIGTPAAGDQLASPMTGGQVINPGQLISPGPATVNRVAAVPQHPSTSPLIAGPLGVKPAAAAAAASSSAFLTASRRFNTYSRSNSAPSSTGDLLVSAEVLRNELKNKRKLKQEESLVYEEEEDEEEYDLSSDENEPSEQATEQAVEQAVEQKPTVSTVSADNGKPASSSELPACSSMTNLDNKLQENCMVSKHNRKEEEEDDDYDA